VTTPSIRFRATVLNSPDPQALARFYSKLLGWPLADDAPDWARLEHPDGGTTLSFQIEEIYVRPVWPAARGEQQMQLHLDFLVEDLHAASAHAEACGATLASYQTDDDLRVYLDPDGHPFCLFTQP
jgi:catechol 2,3-dioxygenase-like lactoylglutathione lyase family enzyme